MIPKASKKKKNTAKTKYLCMSISKKYYPIIKIKVTRTWENVKKIKSINLKCLPAET